MPDLDEEYKRDGLKAGFSEAQLRFLDDYFPGYEHHHSMEEIDGLEDALEGAPTDLDEDDEDEI